MDLSKNVNLEDLDVAGNRLISIDVSNNDKLTHLNVYSQTIFCVPIEKDGKFFIDLSDYEINPDVITEITNGSYNPSTKRIELSVKDDCKFMYFTGFEDVYMDVEIILEEGSVKDETEAETFEEVNTEAPVNETVLELPKWILPAIIAVVAVIVIAVVVIVVVKAQRKKQDNWYTKK